MDNANLAAAAIALYNESRYDEALARIGAALPDEATAVDPACIDLLNIAAACARALGNPEQALAYWQCALRRDPAHAATWNNLGILLQETGRAVQAESAYRRALALQPSFADAHYNLGLLLQQAGALDAAAASYRHALALRPDYAEARNNLGLVLAHLGRPAEAAGAQALQEHADRLQQEGRWVEAEACYRAALERAPERAELYNNLAVLQSRMGLPDAAEASYRRALALRPDYADALHNLATLYGRGRRHAQAEAALQAFLALRPGDPDGLNSLGNLYQQVHRYADAEQCYRRALARRPADAKTLNNLAVLLQHGRRGAEAEAAYRAAIAADPAYPEARWNLGFLLLAQGRLEEGWPWMEARYDPALARPIAVRPQLPFPQWQGEPLAGRSIVVWPEQGFGDQIQFVRYLPLLKAAGARHVTLVCQDPLAPLLRGAAGADTVLAMSEAADGLPAHDVWVFMLSLPLHFRTALATIPAAIPYLAPDPARVAYWRGRLGPAGLRVGLVWRGFGGHVNDVNRSLPDLACLAPLWRVPGVSFVSLQRGMDGEAAPAARPDLALLDLGREIADFADTAAIVSLLDLVICVDTAVAHVAGALGTPCRVLLPAVHADWRWMEDRADSPWYPGVLQLYRQRLPGDWEHLVEAVASDLAALARRR